MAPMALKPVKAKKSIKDLLQVRMRMKRHQPLFVVKESHKTARIKPRWRANRGIHSGQRQRHRGKPSLPTSGYRTPRLTRNLHPSGLSSVMVRSPSELEHIDARTQGVIIGAAVGRRKKLQMLEVAIRKNLTVLNVGDIQKARESIQSRFAARLSVKKEKLTAKSNKEMERKKKAAPKKEKTESASESKPEQQAGTAEPSATGSIEEALRQEKEKERKEAEKTLLKPQ